MHSTPGFFGELAEAARERVTNFDDPRQEWRRLVRELVGTFLLVIVAAGAPIQTRVTAHVDGAPFWVRFRWGPSTNGVSDGCR